MRYQLRHVGPTNNKKNNFDSVCSTIHSKVFLTDFQLITKFNWNNPLIIGLIEREIKNKTLKAMKQMWKSWKSQASNRYRYLNLKIMNMSMQCFDTVAVFWYCFSSQNIVHVKNHACILKLGFSCPHSLLSLKQYINEWNLSPFRCKNIILYFIIVKNTTDRKHLTLTCL